MPGFIMGVRGAEPTPANAAVESGGRVAGLIHRRNRLTRPHEVPGFCLIHLLQHGPSSWGQYTLASRRGMPEVSSRSCREFCGAYFVSRITPIPTFLRSRSVYFSRAFSAASFVLNGFDNGVNSPSTYLKSSHCLSIRSKMNAASSMALSTKHCLAKFGFSDSIVSISFRAHSKVAAKRWAKAKSCPPGKSLGAPRTEAEHFIFCALKTSSLGRRFNLKF